MGVLASAAARPWVLRVLATVIAVNFLSGVATVVADAPDDDSDVVWTMVDVTNAVQQGDAHVIAAGDRVVLVDAGTVDLARARLLPFLDREGIDRLDLVFVSHAHVDHYGGLRALLEAGIDIGRVEVSLPDAEVCRSEVPWGCDEGDIRLLLATLREAGIPVEEPLAPMTWDLGDGATISLVERLDTFGPATGSDVNDTSMVLRLDVDDTSVLFTGDLNHDAGRYLSQVDLGLRSTVLLKVPHHGAESLVPNEFFETVDPDVAFVTGVVDVWRSERSRRTREWLEAHDVPTFVSGEVGTVTVRLGPGLHIRTDRPAPAV